MKTLLSPKTIDSNEFFNVLEKKIEHSEFLLLKSDFEKSYSLWKGCNITLSITLCHDTYVKFCNDTTAKPNVSFREKIKSINCEYMFAIPYVSSKLDDHVVIHIFLKDRISKSCERKIVTHNFRSID